MAGASEVSERRRWSGPNDATKEGRHMADTHTTNDLDKLADLLHDVRFTMFTTRVDGRLHARPMTTMEADTSGSLWFFISADADTLDEIAVDPSVGLAYADNGKGTYISVAGDAALRDDPAKVRELWNPAFKAWFEGPDDPNLRLVEVRIRAAEYWDSPDSRVVRLVGIVAAAVTGDEYDAGEQGTIAVSAGSGGR
jgi:general stress protein 26